MRRGYEGSFYTRACGNRTLVPYTMPFRTPFTSERMSWYLGSRTTFSIAACPLHEYIVSPGSWYKYVYLEHM